MRSLSSISNLVAVSATLVAIFFPLRSATAGPMYFITDLGVLNGTASFSSGINNNSQVVGKIFLPGGKQRAFRYSNGAMTDLGALADNVPNTLFPPYGSFALGINDLGDIVGQSATGDTLNSDPFGIISSQNHATLFSNGNIIDIGKLVDPDRTSFAYSINNKGQVVGWVGSQGGKPARGFLYSNGIVTEVPTLGGTSGNALAINDKGQITGSAGTGSGGHAFIDTNGVMTDLGTLGGSISVGFGINAEGEVAGTAYLPENNAYHAFRYSNGTMLDLGTLGGTYSDGFSINKYGQVVGSSYLAGDTTVNGFLYSGNILYNLNDLVDPRAGWTIGEANAINDKGQIAASGTRNGENHALLLTLIVSAPEPNTLWLVSVMSFVGFAVYAVRIRRRHINLC